MPDDFRLSTGFFDHPRTIKLRRRCGDLGLYSLIRLIGFCAKSKTDGVLSGLDDEDIEIAAAWDGEPGALVGALVGIGFLEVDENGQKTIHNWAKHQPWVGGFKERSEAAKKANAVRWHKKGAHSVTREGCPLCAADAQRSPTASDPESASDPIVSDRTNPDSPIPNSNSIPITNSLIKTNSADAQRNASDPQVRTVVGYYKQQHPGRGKSLSPGSTDWKRIRARLKEGFTPQDLCDAVDGNLTCEWHSRTKNHTPEYIFRNASKVEKFIQIKQEGNSPPKSKALESYKKTMEWAHAEDEQENPKRPDAPSPPMLPAAQP